MGIGCVLRATNLDKSRTLRWVYFARGATLQELLLGVTTVDLAFLSGPRSLAGTVDTQSTLLPGFPNWNYDRNFRRGHATGSSASWVQSRGHGPKAWVEGTTSCFCRWSERF